MLCPVYWWVLLLHQYSGYSMIRQQQVNKSYCFTSTLDIILYPVYWWSRKTCLLAAVVSYCIQCTGEAGRLVYLLLRQVLLLHQYTGHSMIRQQQVDKSSCFTSTLDTAWYDSSKTCLLAAVVSCCVQCTGEAVRLVYLLLSYHAVSSVLVKQEDLSTCCCRIMLCPVYWWSTSLTASLVHWTQYDTTAASRQVLLLHQYTGHSMIRQQQVDKSYCFTSILDTAWYDSSK
jgi:hypothetical protein